MRRFVLFVIAGYGFAVSRTATRNIKETRSRAQAGDAEAAAHFTQTRYARVFGPRNSDLGMVYYGAVAVAAGTGLIRLPSVRRGLMLVSIFSILTSLYLLWALFFRLRVVCPICLKGHAVNVTLLALLSKMGR